MLVSGRSINRTIAAGLLAIPGASFFAPGSTAESLLMPSDNGIGNCATVYDETRPNHNEIDPKLAPQIGALAARGVTVHVQIWDGATAHGVNTNESLKQVIDTTVATCEWPDDNSLALTFVRYTKDESRAAKDSVGKLDVRENGPIDQQISDTQINTAKATLAVALRDPKEAEQADIADFLAKIAPAQSKQPEQTVQKSSSNEFDWSILWWGAAGLGAIVAIATGALRGKRIIDSRRTKSATLLDISHTVDELLQVKTGEVGSLYSSGNPLDIDWGDNPLTARDDPGLERMLTEKQDLDTIIESLRELRVMLGALAKPWSGATLEQIHNIGDSVRLLLGKVPLQKKQYLEARTLAIEAIGSAPKTVGTLTTLLANFEVKIDTLEKAGWDVSSLRKSWGKYSESSGGVQIAMGKQHLIAASNQAKDIMTSLSRELTSASAAEETFTSNATRNETRSGVVKKYKQDLATDQATLASLRERFDVSCTERIGALQRKAESLTSDLERQQAELSVAVEEKSFKALDEVAQKTESFTGAQVVLERHRQELADTIAHLEKLAEELPGDVSESELAYRTDSETVRSWGHDIDGSLMSDLDHIERDFEELNTGLGKKQPAYFDLESSFGEATTKASRLMQAAREQHTEAEGLRQNITRGNAVIEDELNELRRYVTSNSDASHISLDISLRQFSAVGSRGDLRKEYDAQRELRQRIEHRLAEAKRVVREAEAERERVRLAAIAAEEAERRREQEELDRQRRHEEDLIRQREEASRPSSSHNTSDIGGDSGPSHNTSDL